MCTGERGDGWGKGGEGGEGNMTGGEEKRKKGGRWVKREREW